MATFWGLWVEEGSLSPNSARAGPGELWVVSKGPTLRWRQGQGQWLGEQSSVLELAQLGPSQAEPGDRSMRVQALFWVDQNYFSSLL